MTRALEADDLSIRGRTLTLGLRAFAYYGADQFDLAIQDCDAAILISPEDEYLLLSAGLPLPGG